MTSLTSCSEAANAKVAVWMTNYAAAGSANERHLPKAIDSVLKQTFTDYTLYIFDNHSPGIAPQIIADYAVKDDRIKIMTLPPGLSGIEVADFAWKFLDTQKHAYSITIGGHDVWNTPEHLQIMVERMDAETALRPAALLYCDTWQMNDDDKIVARYQDIKQTIEVATPILPQYVVSGVSSPEFFGLWNEAVRKRVPIRHVCSGFDHLVVMNAALYGAILWEPRVQLIMRCPPPTDNLGNYGRRHLPAATLAAGPKDFIRQLEWCVYCVDQAAGTSIEGRMILSTSMVATYMMLRGTNLHIVPGAHDAFAKLPEFQEIMKGLNHCAVAIRALLRTSAPAKTP